MRVLHFLQPHVLQSPGNRDGDFLTHIFDLAKAQADAGHEVGIVWLLGSSVLPKNLAQMEKFCQLGVLPLHIDHANTFAKIASLLPAAQKAVGFVQQLVADPALPPLVLHGHGASGGDLAHHVQKTLARKKASTILVMSPCGAILRNNKLDLPYFSSQKTMSQNTNGIIFNSNIYQQNYERQFGLPSCRTRLIYDGLKEEEFAPRQIIDMAADFVFVGELNRQTGIDILIQAMARMKNIHSTGALVVGTGPHEKELRAQVDRYGLSHKIYFNAALDPKTAFLKGGCLVLPSKLASIPLIALRAAAAGMPMILTNPGGLPELTGDIDMPLIPAKDAGALQVQLLAYLSAPQAFLARATALKQRVAKQFAMARMHEETEQFYQHLLEGKR